MITRRSLLKWTGLSAVGAAYGAVWSKTVHALAPKPPRVMWMGFIALSKPGETFTAVTECQDLRARYMPIKIIVPQTRSEEFVIHEIRVDGKILLQGGSKGIPARQFVPDANYEIPEHRRQAGRTVSMLVRNVSDHPQDFRAAIIGHAKFI